MIPKKATSMTMWILEIIIVISVGFSLVHVATSFAKSDAVIQVNIAEDLGLMINALVALSGDAVVQYPLNTSDYIISSYSFLLDSKSITVYKKNDLEINRHTVNFNLPQEYTAEGIVEEKEAVCLEKTGKKITLEECPAK